MSTPLLSEILNQYCHSHQALPAFNIDSFEIYQAVEATVKETHLPCIVQLSDSEDKFIQAERLLMLVKKARAEGLPIYLNMDHGKDLSRLEYLARLGFDMIHFDGSALDYQSNLQSSAAFISKIRSQTQALIEVEFNRIRPVGSSIDQSGFTSPIQAFEFISETKADLLAVSVGNLHGVNIDLPEKIDLTLLKDISSALPSTYFTLHGGSGISIDQIKSAIKLGVVKININTDLRLQFRHSLRQALAEVDSEKIYDYLNPVITDLKNIIKQKLIQFSSQTDYQLPITVY